MHDTRRPAGVSRGDGPYPTWFRRPSWISAGLALGCLLFAGADEASRPTFYSTARPPVDYAGPRPRPLSGPAALDASVQAAGGELPPAQAPVSGAAPAPAPDTSATPELYAVAEPPPELAAPVEPADPPITRLASATSEVVADGTNPAQGKLDLESRVDEQQRAAAPEALQEPTARAKQLIGSCRESYAKVRDYTCTFYKRERVDGELLGYQVMEMKSRTSPFSIYFRFVRPHTGREAIYVHGQNRNQVVVHDVGINKIIAGTLWLDPRSRRAMSENRHPITDAGLGHLIETLAERWNAEMRSGETLVTITPGVKVGGRPCTLIESTHPERAPQYLFRTAKVYIDQELNLPIRFEAYDWPRRAGQAPPLMEEYTYANLRVNVGVSAADFDPANQAYSFGRF